MISEKYPATRVQRISGSSALMGDKTVTADGQTFLPKGYYPPLMNGDEFNELQLLVSRRGFIKGKGAIAAITVPASPSAPSISP
ncbi:hypothetical protein HDG34_000105 [Paraburkholderia sp. HC6.4b]|uniref:hypothetical protein n=1 Tax=unclassified Paraburkholderia TaxID=2615204 RepID=UPI00160FFFF4|nr:MULTISPECIES: hypothetical protein [unclassified Paraburkholderia]MBB5406190.1 hypothetical protein [Paraburkholderia sp. HC6.4b]MBB5448586.1 hypothetical protein [Paraburkholderia sp. Kb1A]